MLFMNFQLHTVHQERAGWLAGWREEGPFNSTRCIRNGYYAWVKYLDLPTFNSTRCIRNCLRVGIFRRFRVLSTPHGALGTSPYTYRRVMEFTFNSTRCIRNNCLRRISNTCLKLSTPHGALGTEKLKHALRKLLGFQLHTVHQEHNAFVEYVNVLPAFQLHTVHQEHL